MHAHAPTLRRAAPRTRARPRGTAEGLARGGPGPSAGTLGHQPDPSVRALLESAAGHALGDVRVRTGRGPERLLDGLGVDALTSGRDVVLRREHDHAGALPTRVLLLHELVHVLQQAGRTTGDGTQDATPSAADLEEQAHRTALDLAAGRPGGRPGRAPEEATD